MDLLNRLGRVVQAHINSQKNSWTDPEKLLEQAVSEIEQSLLGMRQALAQAIATSKRTERQLTQTQMADQQCYQKAQLAVANGQDPLAREALHQRQFYQKTAQTLRIQLEQQGSTIQKLKQDLRQLEMQASQAKAKKDVYIARLRTAIAQQKMQELAGNSPLTTSNSLFEQIESKIMILEAEAELGETLNLDPLEKRFSTLEDTQAIDTTLNQLKSHTVTGKHSPLSSV